MINVFLAHRKFGVSQRVQMNLNPPSKDTCPWPFYLFLSTPCQNTFLNISFHRLQSQSLLSFSSCPWDCGNNRVGKTQRWQNILKARNLSTVFWESTGLWLSAAPNLSLAAQCGLITGLHPPVLQHGWVRWGKARWTRREGPICPLACPFLPVGTWHRVTCPQMEMVAQAPPRTCREKQEQCCAWMLSEERRKLWE